MYAVFSLFAPLLSRIFLPYDPCSFLIWGHLFCKYWGLGGAGMPVFTLMLLLPIGGPVSGKGKEHKHKQIIPVTARGGGSPDRRGGGVSRPVARGQKFMCCARNINVLVRVPGREESGARPGGSVTGVTEKLFMCQMFMCLFRPLLPIGGPVDEGKLKYDTWYLRKPRTQTIGFH